MHALQIDGKRFQHGGTLLGLIIGLIVGLAIAVAVALVITKGATPFTTRPGKPDRAAELSPGQIADPNKALYGNKDAAKEAAKAFVKNGGESQPADAAVPPTAKPDNKAPAVEEKSIVEKPKAPDVVKAVEPAANKSEATDDKWLYYLQAGAFREQADAENTRAKLALLGVEAKIADRATDSGNLYRVRIGPFNQVEAMNRIRSKLSDNGVDVAVIRNQK